MGVPLRVVSYNIHSQRDDTAALAAVVRAAAPDVVIVQEGPRRFRWRQKSATLAESFGLVVAAGGLPALGNLLLTSLRVQVPGTRCQRFPLTPGRHLRGAAYADAGSAAPGSPWPARTCPPTRPERPAQAAEFKRGLDEGDQPGARRGGPQRGPGRAGVGDRVARADRRRGGGRPGRRLTYSCADPRRRIDALFVDPRITVVDYDVVDTPQTRRASDHFPVLVDLLLPDAD